MQRIQEARAFVKEIAAWRGVPVPKHRGIKVRASFNWMFRKLVLEGGNGTQAEMYLHLHAGGTFDDIFASLGFYRPIY